MGTRGRITMVTGGAFFDFARNNNAVVIDQVLMYNAPSPSLNFVSLDVDTAYDEQSRSI